jgi:hypothetical protein
MSHAQPLQGEDALTGIFVFGSPKTEYTPLGHFGP